MHPQFLPQQQFNLPQPPQRMPPSPTPPGATNLSQGQMKSNILPNNFGPSPLESGPQNVTHAGGFMPQSQDILPQMPQVNQRSTSSINQNGPEVNQYGLHSAINGPTSFKTNQPLMSVPGNLTNNRQPPLPGQLPVSNSSLPGQTVHGSSLVSNPVSPMPIMPPMVNQQPPMASRPPISSSQMQPPIPNQFPVMGQNPMPHSKLPPQAPLTRPTLPGHPPMPNQPYMPQGPPIPGQQPPIYNQLTNQMQDLHVGQRQYPGGPMKSAVLNGEVGPHMPPPLNHPPYVNGQGKSPGYPSVPGQPPMMGGYPQPSYQQPAQPQPRLDPDQMPSPIQVTQDDQITRSGIFCTNQKGLVPPLVTTKFIVQDQGNASPRFIRSTMYNVPVTQDLMKQTSVPFGLVISPMARTLDQEYPPPIVNFGELGPVRCIRCKAYMCPFMQFIDSGRRFQCLFCKAATDVPAEYFQHLDHTGQRMDRYERPELVLGTYEFVATKDYCRNNNFPKPPAIVFLIDVSYNNVKSGLVNLLCSQMKEIIRNLPVDQGMEKSNMKVGFITYNSTVHFYNIKSNLAAPQMMVVGDVQDMFMPLLEGFLCTPEESETVIEALMQQIPQMFNDTRETETVLLPAILAGLEALKASECSGKLLVFHSTLPIAEAPGKLKNRDDRKLLGTEKEKTVLQPQTQAYVQLGQECVAAGCSVDLFLFNNAYIDIATIGQVSRLTGGEVFKYTYFQADLDGDRLISDIITNISKPIAFDAIMRVRTSTGIRPTDFYGHLYMSNTTDMELASIDCDKAIALEIKHDDKLTEEDGVYIQVALLYTSCSGQRRLRIINLSLKTCVQMADLYRSCDLDTLINFFSKQSVYKLMEHNPKAVKDNLINRAAQILANYRKNCASPSSAGQLILPECMKLLPLYVNCLIKSDAISGGSDMTVDDRSFVMQAVTTMNIPNSVFYFYPRLVPLHELHPSDGPQEIPARIRCTMEKMIDQGVYLLENGIHMMMWIGLGVNSDFCQQVFGVPSCVQIDVDKVSLPILDNPLSRAVHSLLLQIREERSRHMRLTLVRQREKLEPIFKHFLVEDKGLDNSSSYVDFLCHMHKEIRSILS
ncbi:hypothetical protein PPYR_15149 [Photinus pyralis]|uniref:Protein transport protein Sec24C n=1 Tax=Photinus pyralis TaxID=7054 RepID=A0A1Y1MFN5_PHOPY|nr:protein transport protein Sec24C [Photinus pyralis]XP_031358375.1 protein transport protein Sec24C [Photinus pyralis]KAB0790460.1 hypothetical protein PPYR_15149 [Photinus pyralis]